MIPENEFAARFPEPVSLIVNVPASDSSAATTITISIPVMSLVKDLKEILAERTGMAPNKQQIKFSSAFLKDTQTLASANVGNGAAVELVGRSRGGGKR